jgi:hypothetical protein
MAVTRPRVTCRRYTMTIRCVASKPSELSALFHSNSTNSGRIANWRMGGECASKIASFTYILYCDTITTQILKWSQSSEFLKMRLCCMIYPAKKPPVYVRSGLPPRQDCVVRFFGLVSNRTEPNREPKTRPLAGYPHPLLLGLFVIILHSPRRCALQSYHKPADHWLSWHLINIFYPCPSETSHPSIS